MSNHVFLRSHCFFELNHNEHFFRSRWVESWLVAAIFICIPLVKKIFFKIDVSEVEPRFVNEHFLSLFSFSKRSVLIWLQNSAEMTFVKGKGTASYFRSMIIHFWRNWSLQHIFYMNLDHVFICVNEWILSQIDALLAWNILLGLNHLF